MVLRMNTDRVLSARVLTLSPVARYGVAIAAGVAAVAFRLSLDPIWGIQLPFITLFPAIMLSAWLGGLGPGLLTTAITAVAAEYYWIEPARSFAVADTSELVALLVFIFVGAVISALNEAWRRGTSKVALSEERLKVTLTSIGDGVITTDDRGRVTRLNAVAEQLTGWAAVEAIGRPLRDVFVILDERSRGPADNPVDNVLREGLRFGLGNPTVLIAKDGRETPIDDSAAPIKTEDGRLAGVIMVFRDITERRHAEREREGLLQRERAARIDTERLAQSEQAARAEAETAARVARESAERLRITIASIGDAVTATDARGRITQLNPVAEKLTGWREAEALGRTFAEVLVLVNEETRKPAPNPVEHVLREGVVVGLANHTLLIARDGREIPIDDSAAPVRDDAGQLLGAVMVFRDITERRQNERERDARERIAQELAAIIESSDDAIVGKDLNGVITAWNGAAERMYGYAAHDAIGQSIRLIVPEDRWREEDEILERINRGERLNHFETLRRRRDGRTVAVSLTVSPIRDANGVLVGASKTARDISARKEVEQARSALLEREHAARVELERASRMKDEFLAVLSHELRTPLNAVLGYASLLATGSLPRERTAHALKAIQRNAQAQSRLIESLLDLSRITAGKLELDLRRTDARKLVESAVDVVRPDADAKGIAVAVEGPSVDVPLVGDGGRLQQVLWNLLSNAVKFTPAGGHIRVRLAKVASDVRIEVEDTGQGIKGDFLPYVFDRFKQDDRRKESSSTGLGLGLALVREMVQAHGGTVRADSAGEGRGSTFTVTLPSREPASMTAAAESDETPDVRDVDVLVVDDDGDMRDVAALLLESRGATVRTVSSARAALEAISQHRPDVMLADLFMPGEDGYSLIRTLRARENKGHLVPLPVIAVTASASPADKERALTAGFDSHLAKPFDAEALIGIIAKFRGSQNV
jgi:PAS domain S-box-containing protein